MLPVPNVPDYGFLDHAAAALGAAADKFGFVGPDLIVYQNAILGIPSETTVQPTIAGDGIEGLTARLRRVAGPV